MKNDNILNLEEAHHYSCQLWRYGSGLSSLMIRANKGGYMNGEVRFIHFAGAIYFSGPFHWRTANLKMGTEDECLKLLFQISDSYRRFATDELLEQWHLYKFQDKTFCVGILANAVSLGIIDDEGLFRDID